MSTNEGAKIGIAQHVTVERQEGTIDSTGSRKADRTRRAERLVLDHDLNLESWRRRANTRPEALGQVARREDHALDAGGSQPIQQQREKRHATNRQHRLWLVKRQRTKAGPRAPNQHDRDHA